MHNCDLLLKRWQAEKSRFFTATSKMTIVSGDSARASMYAVRNSKEPGGGFFISIFARVDVPKALRSNLETGGEMKNKLRHHHRRIFELRCCTAASSFLHWNASV
jgi:hypothetical protein